MFHSGNGFASGAPAELYIAAGVSLNKAHPQRSTSAIRTTKHVGDAAEDEVAEYLVARGHTILARNWRTKFCEIDIVSRHDDTVYFTEVKYRKSDHQGGGLEAITPKKQRQMAFAAEVFVARSKLTGMNLRLAAADSTGTPPRIKTYLELN
jgi:uncharacterized protein (TIGR00252 family)